MSTRLAASPTAPPFRLPWPAMAATLVACAALFEREGGSLVLPVLVAIMLASYASSQRMGNRIGECGPWLIALLLPVFLQNLIRAPSETAGLIDASRARYSGEGAAAVLAMECWRRNPDAGGRGVIAILLSALILLAGTSSFEPGKVPYYAPAYAFFLILSLWSFRGRTEPVRLEQGPARYRALMGAALVLALGLGLAGHVTFHAYRNELTDWGMRMLNETSASRSDGTGLSNSPQLGSGPGNRGALSRVFRIEGDLAAPHLRGHAYSDYYGGRWGPSREQRAYASAQVSGAASGIPTHRLLVTRLAACDGILVMPLNTAGLALEDQGEVQWASADGGPFRTRTAAPSDYGLEVAKDESYQGPLCMAPVGPYLKRLTAVPPELGPEVRALAASMVRGMRGPLNQARAIEAALRDSHPYSLQFHPGPGDPVARFLLSDRGAHCEYFAAGAAMLLRCVGIPARYVVGFYAHEGDGTGTTVVRQSDAHAWTEAWIAGTGWVTIDATPASGRPDVAGEKPPVWQRAGEWLQDRWAAAVRAFATIDPRVLAGALGALLCALAVSAVLKRRQRTAPARPFAYSDPKAGAADLRARFEALCRARGLEFPPSRPWSEVVLSGGAEGFDEDAAAQFVRLYNSLRFGHAGPDAIAALHEAMDRVSRDARPPS